MNVYESLRQYWNEDAATYDLAPEHFPHSKAQEAAWSAALSRQLPPHPLVSWTWERERDRSRFLWPVSATKSRPSTFHWGCSSACACERLMRASVSRSWRAAQSRLLNSP